MSKTKEPRTIKVGDIEIYEDGQEKETATVSFQIPVRMKLFGRRELDEYKKLAVEDMRIKATTLFELVEYFGQILSSGNYDGITFSEQILLAGQLGQACVETMEAIETDFEREAKK